jgi:dihydropyrimidine dehydrogenase (NAD+) subunit PreT
MTDNNKSSPDIRPKRLDKSEIDNNFSDLHPALTRPEALIEADRCYFCYDAPCTTACPTGIDIPAFIQKIRSDNLRGSAHTILKENIMGGMCARVCPTEILCEEACVRNTHEEKPVNIGLLQRHATDGVFDSQPALFERAKASGKRIAVIGAGPAGLSCAHRLAMLGHEVLVLDRAQKPGGLNEYGIAAYKTVDDFAQKEVGFILSIGGITIRNDTELGVDYSLQELRDEYDAVFVGIGLGSVNALGVDNETLPGIENAIDYIASLRQARDKSELPVGKRVVVIGGGMTAIDIAVQSKRLGAEHVDVVYRRGPEQMGASRFEQELAQKNGVNIHHWAQPYKLHSGESVSAIEFERTTLDSNGQLKSSGETFVLVTDVLFKAIGQRLVEDVLGGDSAPMDTVHGRIVVDAKQQTSLEDVWAGGDCVSDGDDLTVTAVQHGKVAAIAIDQFLRA